MNETFLIGEVNDTGKKLVHTTWECLQKAIEAGNYFGCISIISSVVLHDSLLKTNYNACLVRPGEKYREIGNVIQKFAQSKGFSVVRSYCGHGIHKLFHTAPSVPHYASEFSILLFISIFFIVIHTVLEKLMLLKGLFFFFVIVFLIS